MYPIILATIGFMDFIAGSSDFEIGSKERFFEIEDQYNFIELKTKWRKKNRPKKDGSYTISNAKILGPEDDKQKNTEAGFNIFYK